MQPTHERGHRQLLRAGGGTAVETCLFVDLGGMVGMLLDEGAVGCLFKLVLLEVIQQIQPVIGPFGLLLVLLLFSVPKIFKSVIC